MARPNDDDIDVYELLNRADELLEEEDLLLREEDDEDYMGGDPDFEPEFEPDFDAPIDMDATIVYRNAANSYGRGIRNAANNYGAGPAPVQQAPPVRQSAPVQSAAPVKPTQAEKAVSSIRAYNADFHMERERSAPKKSKKITYSTPSAPEPAPAPTPAAPAKQKKPKKHGCMTRLIALAAVIAVVVLLFNLFICHPKTDDPLGSRKNGVSAILLCGADIGGERTDTMMLLYVDSVNKQAGLLTLPRDTYTVSIYGESNKLNSAYWRNGCGEEGMTVLFDYVQKLIGYRPDGYMLIELPVLRDLVDLMGGVEFDVPQDMAFDGVGVGENTFLNAGLQHLNGEQAIGLLRFRYGYYNQDLGRQDVQKSFLKACMEQWVKPSNFSKFFDALDLMEAQSFTDLSTGNFAWFGLHLLRSGFSNIYTDTLPGYATMIGDQSYYVLYPEEVAALIQDRYNPYKVEITTDILDIDTE